MTPLSVTIPDATPPGEPAIVGTRSSDGRASMKDGPARNEQKDGGERRKPEEMEGGGVEGCRLSACRQPRLQQGGEGWREEVEERGRRSNYL